MSEPIDRIREYFKPSELCLKVDWMTKENARINSMIDDIEDENATLREERDKWRQDYERLMQERIANVGAGVTPTYHATESVEEAKAVVELGIEED